MLLDEHDLVSFEANREKDLYTMDNVVVVLVWPSPHRL
jgi:hypothetical protein